MSRTSDKVAELLQDSKTRRFGYFFGFLALFMWFFRDKETRQLSILVSLMLVLLSALGLMALFSDESGGDSNLVHPPALSSEYKGEDYKIAMRSFEEAGFTNVSSERIEDLITGWITKNGEVERVTIEGKDDFTTSKSYDPSVPVTVYYHTFPQKDEEKAADGDSPVPTESQASSTPSTDSSGANALSTPSPTPTATRLTAENNADLSEILNVGETNDPLVSQFAEKYKGQEIEFDGNYAYVSPEGNSASRKRILIYSGDYDPDSARGAAMQFRDIDPQKDLGISNPQIGANVHIVARVERYETASSLLILTPIQVTPR